MAIQENDIFYHPDNGSSEDNPYSKDTIKKLSEIFNDKELDSVDALDAVKEAGLKLKEGAENEPIGKIRAIIRYVVNLYVKETSGSIAKDRLYPDIKKKIAKALDSSGTPSSPGSQKIDDLWEKIKTERKSDQPN